MPSRPRAGFTLIELSIVLVIIGLVIGGVMVGRDLLDAAKVRAQISQFEEMKSAYMAFRIKYGCIAGDCSNATEFLGTATTNGNGNGIVENNDAGCAVTGGCRYAANYGFNFEMAHFFEQLSLAGMISGRYIDSQALDIGYPSTKLSRGIGGLSVTRDRFTYIDMCNRGECCAYAQGLIHSYDCMGFGEFRQTLFVILNYPSSPTYRNKSALKGIFTPAQTYSMDSKIDDGKPFSGSFRAANASDSSGTFPDGDCAEDYASKNADYNLLNTTSACHTALKLE